MIRKKNSFSMAILLLLAAYIAALAGGLMIFILCPPQISPVLSSLAADIGATLVIFLFSWAFKNSSFYDPYWSVLPFVIALYWSVTYGNPASLADTIILLVILLWAIRLTLNFLRGWKGLSQEDWRYKALRLQSGKYFGIVNLLGIHIFPTLIVFAGMMPVYVYLHRENITEDYNYIFWGSLLSLTGTLVELIADEQLRAFKLKNDYHKTIDIGLWRTSRHPNYLGEIMFWWGLWIMMMGVNGQFWWTVTGALSITLMFIFISIPMIEKKAMLNKPDYKNYKKKVSMIIPWFRGK